MLHFRKVVYLANIVFCVLIYSQLSWSAVAAGIDKNELKQWLQENSDNGRSQDDGSNSTNFPELGNTEDIGFDGEEGSGYNQEDEEAFAELLKKNMPLTPSQVLRLRKNIDISQRAAAVTPNVPPKPVSTNLAINLSPGTTAPAIRLAQGYVSSLVFLDSTGAPWPIVGYQIGNPKATNIQWDGKSNILMLQAISSYNDGNLVVRLYKLDTPITLELISGQRVVDFRVDLHVNGLGPNAKPVESTSNLPEHNNTILLQVLDGIAPKESKQLEIAGDGCQGWLLGDTMYLRTRFTILSPGWTAKLTSSDGMQAYEMPRSSSVLISHDGEPVALKIEGL